MARKAVFYAQEEAQLRGEYNVCTEHLLLGILRSPECSGCRALSLMGLSLDALRAGVERETAKKANPRPSQDMTLTPRAKHAIDLAYDEARELNNDYIGTEHLLLGLIAESEGSASRVLAAASLDLQSCRQAIGSLQPVTKIESPPPAPAQRIQEAHKVSGVLLDILFSDSAGARLLKAAGADEQCFAEIGPALFSITGDAMPPPLDEIFRLAHEEALNLGSRTMTSAHVVLAFALGNPPITEVLHAAGVTIESLRHTLRGLEPDSS